MSEGRLTKLEQRRKCLFDRVYLAQVLGYEFNTELVPHSEELLYSIFPRIQESEKLCEPLPLFEQDKIKQRLVLWSRGHWKTSGVAITIVNLILAFPDIRILIGQATAKNARNLLREIKSAFDGSNPRCRLDKLFPEFCRTVRMGSADSFITPARKRTNLKDPTVAVAGSRTSRAGGHYDVGFFDDLVTEQNWRNQELQEKLIVEFDHYTPLIEPGGYVAVTGTRYSFGDLYGHLIRRDAERREWAISVRTCWKENDRKNGPLFPRVEVPDGFGGKRVVGFTTELLDRIQKDDPEIFACQYLNQPIAAGQQRFTEPLLMQCVRSSQDKDFPALGPKLLFLDLAASKQTTSDHSVILCSAQDTMGRSYVVDLRADRWSPMQVAQNALQMALKHRPVAILIEGTAAGMYFIEYLKVMARDAGLTLNIQPIKVSNQKDAKFLRIAATEGYMKTGRLFFVAGLPEWQYLVDQYTQFPKGRHDDEIDTIALMLQYYSTSAVSYAMPQRPSIAAEIMARSRAALDPIEIRTPVQPDLETCGADFAN